MGRRGQPDIQGNADVPVRIRLMGLFEVGVDRADAAQLPARARAVLAVLATQVGRPVSRNRLAEMIWPRSDVSQGKQSLRQAIKAARAVLSSGGGRIDSDVAAGTVWLADAVTDVAELERIALSPDEKDIEAIRMLCRGPFLDDFPEISEPFETWLQEQRMRLSTLAGDTLGALAARLLGVGNSDRAIAAARDLVRMEPLREDAHRLLMQAYAAAGRGSEAFQQFEDLSAVLKSELGVAPDPVTRKLAEEIKAATGRGQPLGLAAHPVPESAAAPSAVAVGLLHVPSVAGEAVLGRLRTRIFAGVTLALGAIVVAGYTLLRPPAQPDTRPTYSVAPFSVVGEGEAGRHLAKALATRLSNGISGIPNVRVIATQAGGEATDFRVEGTVAPGPQQTEVQAWIVNGKTGQAFGRTSFKAPPGETPDVQTLILGKIGDDLAVALNRNIYPPPDASVDHKRARQMAQEARLRIDRKSADVYSTLDLFRQAIRLSPDDIEIASWFANALIAEGGSGRTSERDRDALYREATELIDETLRKAPHHRLALYARCQLLRLMSKPHAAYAACEDSNKVLPWSARIHKEVGFIRLSLGDIDGALQNFSSADSLERRLSVRWIWKYGAGLALMLADRHAEAQGMLREAISLHEESFNAHLVLAVVCQRMGESACVASSINHYRAQARQLNPARVLDVILPAANPYSADIAPKVQAFKAEALKLLGEQS